MYFVSNFTKLITESPIEKKSVLVSMSRTFGRLINCHDHRYNHLHHHHRKCYRVVDANFKCIFFKDKFGILWWILVEFVRKGPIDNESELVEMMTLLRTITWVSVEQDV